MVCDQCLSDLHHHHPGLDRGPPRRPRHLGIGADLRVDRGLFMQRWNLCVDGLWALQVFDE